MGNDERDLADGQDAPRAAAVANPDEPEGDYHKSSLWRWSGAASLVGGAMFAVFGWMLVAGAIAQSDDDSLANARPADLVQILDSLDVENDRLEQEQRQLAAEVESLTSGSRTEALEQARAREASLEVLAGTTKVRGPGVRIVIRDAVGGVDAAMMLETVQELRDAGAESIEVSERRVVVNTWFGDQPDSDRPGVLVSGDFRPSPYTLLAIGDPETLATAMEIPGGVAATVRTAGASFEMDRRESLDITSTVPLVTPEYAEPVEPN